MKEFFLMIVFIFSILTVHAQNFDNSINQQSWNQNNDNQKELENYILQNKHLPEILSAIEANENGVNLGDMNHLLLKKIEELTLYIIQQQKEIDIMCEILDAHNLQ